jgi:lipopolysaccharide export system protein LptA
MAKVVDKLSVNSASVETITLGSQSGPSVLFTGADFKLSTSGSILDSFLAQITTSGKIADSATTATVTNTASAIVKTDTPTASINVSSMGLSTPDALFIRGANQSISNNTLTKFTTFTGGTVLDQGSITLSSGDFTIGTAGTYAIAASMFMTANTTGWRQAQIVLNGSTVVAQTKTQASKGSGIAYRTSASCEVYLATNDVISFWCCHTRGSASNMIFPRVSIVRLF